jgi:hypothetical protein
MYLALSVRHRPPFGGGEDALFGGLGLVTKDLSHQLGIGSNPLEEHKVCAKRFLRRIRIFNVPLAGLASLPLGSPEDVLSLDVLRGERPHVGFMLPLPGLLRRL